MNRLANRFIVVVFGMLLACSVFGEYKGNGGENNDPLGHLSKRQKDSYKAYVALLELAKKDKFDRVAAMVQTFGEVRSWCEMAARKYRSESVKAGDKAKESENEKYKKQLMARSAMYAHLYDACINMMKCYEARKLGKVELSLGEYKSVEQEAIAAGVQVLKREWLCYSEVSSLLYKENTAKNSKADSEKKTAQEADGTQKKTRARGNADRKDKKKK